MLFFGVASFLYVREVNNFAALVLNLPKSVKRECMKPIRCHAGRDDTSPAGGTSVLGMPGASLPALFNAVIVIVLAGGAAVLFAQMINIEEGNQLCTSLNMWAVFARARKCYVVESAINSVFLSTHEPPTWAEHGMNPNPDLNQTEQLPRSLVEIPFGGSPR
jgi:hypothetical protein